MPNNVDADTDGITHFTGCIMILMLLLVAT